MKEFIDSVLDGLSNGFRFLIAVCSILLCLILRDVRHDVRKIKEYLVPEIEEVADTRQEKGVGTFKDKVSYHFYGA